MSAKVLKCRNPASDIVVFPDNLSEKNVICTEYSTHYIPIKRERNPLYESGLEVIPRKSVNFKPKQKRKRKTANCQVDAKPLRASAFESSLLILPTNVTTNIEVISTDLGSKQWVLQTTDKNLTTLRKVTYASHVMDTGEVIRGHLIEDADIVVGDMWNGIKRRDKSINAFCKHFAPLYEARKVSMFFFTLTIADQTGVDIRNILDILKKRGKTQKPAYPVIGYHWVLEVSESKHVHYHVIVVTRRMHLKGKKFPEWLFLDNQWKARTQVSFVKGDVYQYCCKYLKKGIVRVVSKRMFGKSITKIKTKKK
jgi:hypothetical protein